MNTYEQHDQDMSETNKCHADVDDISNNDLIQKAMDACQQELAEWKDKYLRIQADLDNLRRRMYKEQEQAIWKAQADILVPLLLVADNFDRAQHELDAWHGNLEISTLIEGVKLIHKELHALFERFGVKEMQSFGQFDPTTQEAIASITSDTYASGDVVDVLQKGYTFKGVVLRPARVSVAQ